MKHTAISICSLLFLFVFFSNKSIAQQLVYTPINPNFGGSSFNGAWLMAEATAEKHFTASSTSSYNPYSNDPLQNFQSNLNNAILSQLSQKIISQVFGESALTKGHYQFGNYIIDINPGNDGIHISILDNLTGGQTSVIVPFY
ncbi:MAG TPA: curli assembly protein CsgF [Ignavibacteriaceae bacterium]|nr:curli assembly protein CsgF [Ignavibacteriaceae bacterium]